MKSVGTRTTLPRAPPLSRRCPADRSCSAERLPRPPATISDGTASSDERGSVSIGTGTCTGTDRPTETASSTNTECTMTAPSNNNQLDCGNGAGRREWERQRERGRDRDRDRDWDRERLERERERERNRERERERVERERLERLVRPSAFKPVVPKSFHSMQNLVGQAGGSGEVPEALLLDQDSPVRVSRSEGGGNGNEVVQGGMSDSGRNSLTSLPTYTGSGSGCGPPAVLGPLSASTSHINRLGMVGATLFLSYFNVSHLSDAPAPLRPSPSSDDIIQDLEDRLWEKEQEHMRRNLDQSEAAIIQVFEEKQRVWERQMDELRQNYASRLQQVTRRAQRSQTALQAQITRLSQDKRRLQEEMAALLAQREELERKCLDYRKEQADILPRLEETKWEVCQKAGEISLLKQQLRESQAEVTQRAGEMVALRAQLRQEAQLRHEAQMRQEAQLRHESQLCQDGHQPQRVQEGHWDEAGELRRQLEQLQAALRLERQQRERQALNFDQERHTWQDEKERVLKYQAQLQLSYVETLQKNQALEKRMSQSPGSSL
uniref:Leucine zipper tumor suppressor family member 3 n=1 Tax=Amphilophus citrinellus TaxID=61819 RepID=A0A3Q0R952_AMPCI